MPADLAADTTVTPLPSGPGWYTGDLPDAWDFATPSGGVLMTVALRAMEAELADPDLAITSATTLFMSPVPNGPLEIRVEVLRHGGAAAQIRAALSSTRLPGPGLEVSATFTRPRQGPETLDAVMPGCPGPEASPPLTYRVPGRPELPRIFDQIESRMARGSAWWEDGTEHAPGGPARFGRWFRYGVPQRNAAGNFDPMAVPPIADTMPPALWQRIGSAHLDYVAPSLDLTIHWLEPTESDWLLVDSHARHAARGYATADAEIWDPDGRLVAVATQMMILRHMPRSGP